MFVIDKWCKAITDSGKDEYTGIKIPPQCAFEFRLRDDDGIVYAHGWSNDDSSFDPLDRYQMDYGVTEIQYKNSKRKYVTL